MTEKYYKLISYYNPVKEWRCISCEDRVHHPKDNWALKSKLLPCNDNNARICEKCLEKINAGNLF